MTKLLLWAFIKNRDDVQNPAVRQQYGLLSGAVGIVLNLLLTAGKLAAGLAASSIAVMADAFNNLTDAASSVVTLVGFRLAGQKADEGHPFGHGRMEYLSGLVVSLLILLVGLELGKSSVEAILHPAETQFSLLTAGVLLASVLVKLWMCLFNRSLSRRIGSAAMAATATDSLSDAAATSVVLVGALVGHFAHIAIDGWLGLAVAVFILRAGWGAAKDTIDPLLGQRPDPALVKEVRSLVLSHPQVTGVHDLVIHDYGPGRSFMSFHAEVPLDADIMEAHDIIDHIERELKETFHIETTVHMDPIATDDQRVNAVRDQVAQLVRVIDPAAAIHDFRMTDGPRHTNLIFDAAFPHSCPLSDQEVARRVTQAVKALDPNYFVVLQVDRVYVDESAC